MQSLFLENPWVLGICGLICALLAAFVWVQTASSAAWYSAILLTVLTLIAVWINVQIKTDREKIKGLLGDIASNIQSNQFEAAFQHIHPNTPGLQKATRELPQYEFSYARISRIKDIQVNYDTVPPTAIAEFNGVAAASRGDMEGRVPRFVRAFLQLEGETWLIRDYEHFDPIEGFR